LYLHHQGSDRRDDRDEVGIRNVGVYRSFDAAVCERELCPVSDDIHCSFAEYLSYINSPNMRVYTVDNQVASIANRKEI
jgi:hypothetical protein